MPPTADPDKSGIVFDIQKYSMHDGPGIRTLVFLKGCPLQCSWCANPEGISRKFEILYSESRCTHCGSCATVCPAGVHRMRDLSADTAQHEVDRSASCTGCGKCVAACHSSALRLAGQRMTAQQVVETAAEDSAFYRSSGGGLTLGGGEPSAQFAFAMAILAGAREHGIHTALETCGYATGRRYQELLRHTDLFLFDLKHISSEPHRQLTGVGNERILANLSSILQAGAQVIVRMPLIRGKNDDRMFLRAALAFLEKSRKQYRTLQEVQLLPYHRLGGSKYEQLGMDYPMGDTACYTGDELASIREFLGAFDLPLKLLTH